MAFAVKTYQNESVLYTGDFMGNLQGEEFTEYFNRQQMLQEEAKGRSKSMTLAERPPPRGIFRAVARRKTVSTFQPPKSPCAKHALALGQQRCSEQTLARVILNCSPEDFRNFKASLQRTGVLTSMGASQVLHSPLQCYILANPCRPRERPLGNQKVAFSAAA
jgi:hypothetical protein